MKRNDNQPLLLTVKEVSKLLRVQRPKIYELIKDGAISGFKVGADWRIRRDSVENLIGEIPEDFFERPKKGQERVDMTESKEVNTEMGLPKI